MPKLVKESLIPTLKNQDCFYVGEIYKAEIF